MTRRARRAAFVVYAVALFVSTHIPDLTIRVPNVDRPDLLIHMSAFGGWFVLLLAAELVGPWRSLRSISLCAAIAVCTAAVDEYSQSIPWVHRTAAWDDFGANVAGVVVAAIGACIAARVFRRREGGHSVPPRA